MEECGEAVFWCERVLLSARPEDIDEVEEFVCNGAEAGGWVVRAREERLGDIVR